MTQGPPVLKGDILILNSRRFWVAVLSILCLTFLGAYVKLEVAGAIATVAIAIAGANATEAFKKKDN